ncbi:hypothetical protein JTE90_008554 [Oedothorax gibbosus]|uniref:Uncharacterized protein n=1 Tax=Oedothorax gibbosus TaxID=931172 RepID=A0AAV6TCP2_9ARAC|nr:hypothetical protein JTE90_008554 [Oedothorax gibbosus]
MFLLFQKKPFPPSRAPTIKGPPVLILPQKYCHKIKKHVHSRQTFSTPPRPGCILRGARKKTRVEKDTSDKLATRTHKLTPHSPPMYDQNMPHIPTEKIFRDGGARQGGRTTRRKAETGEAARLADTVPPLNPGSTDTVPHFKAEQKLLPTKKPFFPDVPPPAFSSALFPH